MSNSTIYRIIEYTVGMIAIGVVVATVLRVVGWLRETMRSRSPDAAVSEVEARPRVWQPSTWFLLVVGFGGLLVAYGLRSAEVTTLNSVAFRLPYAKTHWRAAGITEPQVVRIFMSGALVRSPGKDGTWALLGSTMKAIQEELGPGEVSSGGRMLTYPLGRCRLNGRPWGYHDARLEITLDQGRCTKARVEVGGDVLVDNSIKP